MKRTVLAVIVAVSAGVACGPAPEEPAVLQSSTVTVALPEGDAQAGRGAFQDLRCTACHAVSGDPQMPAPISATPGPPIDAALAGRDISYLLASILTPSHAISVRTAEDVRANLEGVLSPMGDFSRSMTVRQLIDIHAYIRSVR
jgi:hypothetical protein